MLQKKWCLLALLLFVTSLFAAAKPSGVCEFYFKGRDHRKFGGKKDPDVTLSVKPVDGIAVWYPKSRTIETVLVDEKMTPELRQKLVEKVKDGKPTLINAMVLGGVTHASASMVFKKGSRTFSRQKIEDFEMRVSNHRGGSVAHPSLRNSGYKAPARPKDKKPGEKLGTLKWAAAGRAIEKKSKDGNFYLINCRVDVPIYMGR